MNENIEINDFPTRWYSEAEVNSGLLKYKIDAVIKEHIMSGWQQYKEPTITTNVNEESQAIIHLSREKINYRTR